jgi:hypothetical protein
MVHTYIVGSAVEPQTRRLPVFEYTTVDDAMQAFEVAMEDARGDFADSPEVGEDDMAHDLAKYSIAPLCSPEVAKEFLRITIGF